MVRFESQRQELYEEFLMELSSQIETQRGDAVSPELTHGIAHDDGYDEADFVIEVTIGTDLEETIVLMASEIEDDERVPLSDIEDGAARTRARRYASSAETGTYFGVTDGDLLYVESLSPDVGFEATTSLGALPDLIGDILEEEHRIKASEDFVSELGEYYEDLTPHVRETLSRRLESDSEFEEELRASLAPTGMDYEEGVEIPETTVGMLSRQATYLLIDKILFYHLIRENEGSLREELDTELADPVFDGLDDPFPSPSGEFGEAWASDFWGELVRRFDRVQEVDYEPIFDPTTSPLNSLEFGDDPEACLVIREVMDYLYGVSDLSKLFDGPLLAKMYEGLIPPDVRWQWGQTYTPPEIARLITQWTVRDGDDTVLDPSCGTGRFLTSAYERLADLRGVELGEEHQAILNQIHGVDLNQFPAHLAAMSLIAKSLQSVTTNINVDVRDFFAVSDGDQSDLASSDSRILSGSEHGGRSSDSGPERSSREPIGRKDAILMNPPYTRQEALGGEYKDAVRERALAGLGTDGNALEMDRQAAFYVYFMTYATKFVEDDGRIGIIVQNSWMDARYGKDVQKFLLENYRVSAVIGTQRDRMIENADVNTVILFLERETDPVARERNDVKFVQLKRGPGWFERNYGFDRLLELIDERDEYLDDDFRIVSRTQKYLENQNKWGRFVRAPDVYFEEVAELLTKRLEDIADVSLGLTSGLNSFFYLKPEDVEEWSLEDEYLRPLIKSPRECNRYRIDPNDLSRFVLDVQERKSDLKNTNVLDYIEHGESEGVPDRPFFRGESAADWYQKTMHNASLLQPYNVSERHFMCINEVDACVDKRLVCLDTNEGIDPDLVFCYLNSTLGILVKELFGRVSLGEGALDNSVTDSRTMPVIDPKHVHEEHIQKLRDAATELKRREIRDIYGELGAESPTELSIDQVTEDRRAVDKVFMEDICGLSKREQLQIYRGALRLVRDRIAKANSAN